MLRQELSAAELIAREVIQNSEDAAQLFRSEIGNLDIPFRMEFAFKRLIGKEKKSFLDLTGLGTLLEYAKRIGPLDLGIKDVIDIDGLLGGMPLEILEMSDYGARGLRKSPKAIEESAYYNCLLTIGNSKNKEGGAGGSYGFGKSAFINGSNIGLVLAYSCFQSSGKGDPATRRFGGVAYWNDHVVPKSGSRLTGLAAFGDPNNQYEGWIDLPFEDSDADTFAEKCGLKVRDSKDFSDFGTSIIVVCPAVEPEDLSPAIEKFWWPALVGSPPRIQVKVIDYEGKSQAIAPKQNSSLKGFLRAYELATSDAKPLSNFEFKQEIGDGSLNGISGVFAGVADPSTCFDPKKADGTNKESQVCLMRSPRMVVKYLEFGKNAASAPFFDGVFVSRKDPQIEALLRKSEPPTHDYWWPTSPQARKEIKRNEPDLHELLEAIRSGLKEAVNQFKAIIKPPSVREKTGLKNFGKLLSNLMSDAGQGPKPPGKIDPFQIHFKSDPAPSLVREGLIAYSTEIEVQIKSEAEKESYELDIQLIYRIVSEEDGRGEVVASRGEILDSPPSFGAQGTRGTLSKGQQARIRFVTDPLEDGKSVSAQCRVRQIGVKVSEGATS